MKWSQRYFVAAAGKAMEVKNAGELSISSFVCPVARDPNVVVCLLVEIPPLAYGGLGGWVTWVAGDPLLLILKLSSMEKRREKQF